MSTDTIYRLPDGRRVHLVSVTQDRLLDFEPIATVRPTAEPVDSINTYRIPLSRLTEGCSDTCPACWQARHDGHDVGMRHEDGQLFSATCHDCRAVHQSSKAS